MDEGGTITTASMERTRETRTTRTGYLAAIVVNVAMLFVVHRLLEWGLVPFLTEDFRRLLPIVSLSLASTVVVNVLYLTYDPGWFRSLTQLGLNAISLAVVVRTYQVFPFDFSAYGFDWTGLVRLALVAVMVAIGIALVVEVVRFFRRAAALEANS